VWGDDLLIGLVYEYIASRTTKGENIIAIIKILLEHRADPNYVGQGNWRAIDRCIE
jgi:hypothetical protein